VNKAKMFLTKIAEHCVTVANCHKAAMGGEDFDHKAAMESHANLANECLAMCKALDSDLEKGMRPTEVMAINPEPGKVFAVPRAGQRPLPVATDETAIDPQFQKIVSLD
jgi:hypothetical protein